MATPNYKPLLNASENLKALIFSQNESGVNAAELSGNEPFDVLAAKAAFNASESGGGGGGAVDSVNGQTGVVVITKSDVGLGNADNTSDASKPVSTATQTALNLKADLTDTRFPSSGEKAALAGTSGVPSNLNRYVTDTDPRIGALRTFDVVAAYNGSGCRTRTTGAVTAASTALVVSSATTFSLNQGICIKGAGALIRTNTDVVTTNGSPNITSAAGFAASDFGKAVTGSGIPAGATIIDVIGTTAKLSANATASATGVSASFYAPLVTTIAAIAGTAITLGDAAITTVTAAMVQHDDTAAIEAAITAAFNAGGGIVYLTKVGTSDGSGIYRCNRPFNATSKGIITVPQLGDYDLDFIRIKLIGETGGSCDMLSISAGEDVNIRGVSIVSTDVVAASGTMPTVLACSVNVNPGVSLTAWNKVYVHVDDLAVIVPPNPSFGAIRMSGNLVGSVGDGVTVGALGSPLGPVQPTNTESVGIAFPYSFNSVNPIYCGQVTVFGFYIGIQIAELARLRRPWIIFCDTGLKIHFGHKSTLEAAIMYCRTHVLCVDDVTRGPIINLDLSFEAVPFGYGFYPFGDVAWTGGLAGRTFVGTPTTTGVVTYESNRGSQAVPDNIGVTTAPGVEFRNLARPCGPKSKNPIAIYHLADNTDRSGNGYTLTEVGTPTYGAGKIGNCVTLNGTTQYLYSTALGNRFARYGNFTVTGWFNANGVAANQVICGVWKDFGNLSWRVSIETSGKLRLYATPDGGSTLVNLDSAVLSPATWYFFAVRINSTANTVELRIDDGAWQSAALVEGIMGSETDNQPFMVGTDGYGGLGTLLFAGKIDAIHVFDYYASDFAVSELWNGGNGFEI